MKRLSDKLYIIYLPFLAIIFGFILVYTFLHWLLFIKIGIPLREDLLKFWLPFGLPWIPVLIWLRPRINLLKFKNDNGYFGFQFLTCLAISIPTIIAQDYLITATGKLTQLDNISEIEKSDKTKYYSLKNYCIDKRHIVVRNTAAVSGKHNEDLVLLIYVAMPVLERTTDTLKNENDKNIYWLGKKYSEKISNRLSDQEKDDRFKTFAMESQKDFEQTDFDKFSYLEVIGNVDDHDEYNRALEKDGKVINGSIIFNAISKPFETRNGNKLSWAIGSLGIGLVVWFAFLIFAKFKEERLAQFKKGATPKDSEFKEMFSFLIPAEGNFITPILINLNLVIYLAMVIAGLGFVSFKGADLLNWGANFRPLTTDGEWWRLLTNMFLHGGVMHILANMYGLLFVGIFLEPLLGRTKYLLIYLITGILASVASIWWYNATISVGASGAIFGLYGFFLACLLLKVFPPHIGKALLISTLVFVGFNLIMGVAGGIDNAAHIGGLLSGFILGLSLSRHLKPIHD